MYRFLPVAVCAANIGLVAYYFQMLYEKKLLKHRIPEVKNVTPDYIMQHMIPNPNNHCFVGLDTDNGYRVACEFMVNGMQGRSAQFHYSYHPDYFGKAARVVAKDVLDQVSQFKHDNGEPYLDTLVGLTPVSNRLALRFLKLNDFKIVTNIPSGFYLADEDRIEDAVLSFFDCRERRASKDNTILT